MKIHGWLRGCVSLSVLMGSACASSEPSVRTDPLEGYPLAYAMDDCAPWDGIATTIFLSAHPLDPEAPPGAEVPRPHIWISIYESRASIDGQRFEIDQDRIAGAMHCEGEGRCEAASGGWVRVGETSPAGDLVGDFEIELPTGETLAGGFEAQWHERRLLCG